MTHGHLWLCGAASAALLFVAGAADAQTAGQDPMEARIAALEAQLNALRAELAATRGEQAQTRQDVILLSQQTPPPAAPAAAPAAPATPTNGFRIGDHTVTVGGFLKLDMTASDYSSGDPANGDALREFYLPGAIPVGGSGEDTALDFNARQTRLWLATQGEVAGHRVGSRIEMDFQVLPGAGDQRTTSPANLSLRRAFVTIDNWLFGQEWTNFQNTTVLPETADYIGPSEGTVFARQAQVRYTRGPFSVSIENPETTLSPFGGGARIIADDSSLPDFTARYTRTGAWGEASLAGMARQLKYETVGATPIDTDAMGWGLSAAARLNLGANDDLRLMISGGEGIGRYIGLNFANDAVLTASGDLEPIGVVAGFAAWRHVWVPGVRTNLIVSHQSVDNDPTLTGLGVNRSATSWRANVVWSPIRALDVGAEIMTGERELQSGVTGDMTRLHLFTRYGF